MVATRPPGKVFRFFFGAASSSVEAARFFFGAGAGAGASALSLSSLPSSSASESSSAPFAQRHSEVLGPVSWMSTPISFSILRISSATLHIFLARALLRFASAFSMVRWISACSLMVACGLAQLSRGDIAVVQ